MTSKLPDFSKFDKITSKRRQQSSDDWPERYKPLKVLGKGHDGVCYMCEDRENNREVVAVKALNPKRNRRITEHEIMSKLSHPNIVSLKNQFVKNKMHFLIMEFADLGDLCDYVYEREHLSESEARSILLQVAEGAGYMHSRGYCHRDLKLDNIFLCRGGSSRGSSSSHSQSSPAVIAKIGDFGASCKFDQETKLTYRCGTTQYNAPELVKNKGYFGDEIDCWALGVILFVMLFGKFPFDCDTDMHLLWQILKGIKFPETPALSEEVKDLILMLTEPDPTNRGTVDDIREHPWSVGEKL